MDSIENATAYTQYTMMIETTITLNSFLFLPLERRKLNTQREPKKDTIRRENEKIEN